MQNKSTRLFSHFLSYPFSIYLWSFMTLQLIMKTVRKKKEFFAMMVSRCAHKTSSVGTSVSLGVPASADDWLFEAAAGVTSLLLLYIKNGGVNVGCNWAPLLCICFFVLIFRYGFSNMRYIASLISGVGIFMMGAGLSWYHGIMGLLHPEPIESLLWVSVCVDSNYSKQI